MNVHEAKTNFSKLLLRVAAGEEVVISKAGKPIAKLIQIDQSQTRSLGTDAGKIWIADDFDVLPEDIMATFEGYDEVSA